MSAHDVLAGVVQREAERLDRRSLANEGPLEKADQELLEVLVRCAKGLRPSALPPASSGVEKLTDEELLKTAQGS